MWSLSRTLVRSKWIPNAKNINADWHLDFLNWLCKKTKPRKHKSYESLSYYHLVNFRFPKQKHLRIRLIKWRNRFTRHHPKYQAATLTVTFIVINTSITIHFHCCKLAFNSWIFSYFLFRSNFEVFPTIVVPCQTSSLSW